MWPPAGRQTAAADTPRRVSTNEPSRGVKQFHLACLLLQRLLYARISEWKQTSGVNANPLSTLHSSFLSRLFLSVSTTVSPSTLHPPPPFLILSVAATRRKNNRNTACAEPATCSSGVVCSQGCCDFVLIKKKWLRSYKCLKCMFFSLKLSFGAIKTVI